MDFGNGTGTLMSMGGRDVFVAKLDPEGNALLSKSFASPEANGVDVAIAPGGNILVNARANGIDFGCVPPLSSAGSYDILIAELDAATGECLWSKAFGGAGEDNAAGIAVDAAGNLLFAGYLAQLADFGGPCGSLQGGFVAKLDADGECVWVKRFGDAAHSNDIAVDGSGDVLLTGIFQGTIDFGNHPITASNQADTYDVFVAKLDPMGQHLWSKGFGDAANQTGHSVAIDGSGNALFMGTFMGTIDVGGGPFVNPIDPATGNYNASYLMKLDPMGQHLWSKGFMGATLTSTVTSGAVAVDGEGASFITGYLIGTVDFGAGPITEAGTYTYVAKFEP